jgi:signal transduction histidine kinase
MSINRQWANAFSSVQNYSIAKRLLLYIIIFSSFVTLIATSIQLYTDYKRDISAINSRLNEIERGYLASISASLWNLDIKQLELQMDGIKHLPDIQAVEIQEKSDQLSNPLHLLRGTKSENNRLARQFPITYKINDEYRHIGTLSIQASLAEVYQRLRDKAIVILLSQGVKTFLVSMFILYIFYFLVTRHLTELARFVKNIDAEKMQEQLILHRKQRKRSDELDDVVTAFNSMTHKLFQTYAKLRNTNQQLEEDIVARRKAEEEVIRLNTVLEQRVRQRTSELEAANNELGAFCYSVSHDLRAPLRRIEGFRRILNEDYHEKIDTQGKHYLARIEAGTREMADMIDSFLRLSRATQGEMDVRRHNLSEMAETIITRIQEQDPSRKITVEIKPEMFADVDSRFFEVLLANLFDNAWKYSRNNSAAKITFSTLPDSTHPVYYVADNGAGFDMAYANRLFSPFSRLHKADEFEGIGIGLATAQRIISRHGGRIWTKSSPTQGATFYFTLWSRNSDSGQ